MQQAQRVSLWRRQHLYFQQGVVLRQRCQWPGPRRGQQLGRNGDGQPAFKPLRQPQRVGLQLAQLRCEQAGLRLQRPRHRRGLRLAARAVEQGQTELGFQVGNGHADGRWHALEPPRGGRKRARVQHGQKKVNVVAGEGHGRLIYQYF